jgi:hypothetical protein
MEIANNVDIDDTGTFERRDGYTKVADLTNVTAAYSSFDQTRAYIVDNGDLKLLRPDFSTSLVKSGLPDTRLYWQESDNVIFYSGKGASGMLLGDNVWRPLGVPTPNSPAVSAISGSLPAGQYQVAVTNLSPEKMESGCAVPTTVQLLANQALKIVVAPDDSCTANIYITSTDGTELYRAWTDVGAGVYEFNGPLAGLAYPLEIEQINAYPMPDGCDKIEIHEGRLYAARYYEEDGQTVVWYSKSFWLHLFDVANDFFVFSDKVTGMASTADGLVITTAKQTSVIKDGVREIRYWYGAPDGYPVFESLTNEVYIWTERGLLVTPGLKNITEAKVSVPPGNDCVTAYLMKHGREMVVVMTNDQGFANNRY